MSRYRYANRALEVERRRGERGEGREGREGREKERERELDRERGGNRQ